MNTNSLIDRYLSQGRIMQLATAHRNRPWVCSVYYVTLAEPRRLYWLSWPTRRHSQEIASNPHVAATIAIKLDQPVIGVQLEGQAATVIDRDEVARVMRRYVARHRAGERFYDNFVAGTNRHVMYRLVPERVVLFDELHMPQHNSS